MKTTINGVDSEWSATIWRLWEEMVPKTRDGETISSANYFTARPYVDEYNRGSDKHGFVYVLQPRNRVCLAERYA